jgi:hypothetical protein
MAQAGEKDPEGRGAGGAEMRDTDTPLRKAEGSSYGHTGSGSATGKRAPEQTPGLNHNRTSHRVRNSAAALAAGVAVGVGATLGAQHELSPPQKIDLVEDLPEGAVDYTGAPIVDGVQEQLAAFCVDKVLHVDTIQSDNEGTVVVLKNQFTGCEDGSVTPSGSLPGMGNNPSAPK